MSLSCEISALSELRLEDERGQECWTLYTNSETGKVLTKEPRATCGTPAMIGLVALFRNDS